MLLIAAALFMRILVPQGWMPDATAEGLFSVRPCPTQWSGSDVEMAAENHHGHHDMSGEGEAFEHHASEPCAMSGLALAALAGDDVPTLALRPLGPVEYEKARSQAIDIARRRTLPPARAPPVPA